MSDQRVDLRAMGGLFETTARVHRPGTLDEIRELFRTAREQHRRLTLIGGRRSFGQHFLPPEGAEGVDTTGLRGEVQRLEREPDGRSWVSVPGSFTFERLCQELPGYLPHHPPTGDRITLAGALSACTHDAVGYFASAVRRFTVLTPDGTVHDCHAEAQGIAGKLFQLVPGSFGALGVVTSLELCLRKFSAAQRAEINVLENCPTVGYAALDRLEAIVARREYPLGRGLFFYGRRRKSVLLGDRVIVPSPGRSIPPLPLTDDATRRNVVLQGISNRIPGPVHGLQPAILRQGRRFCADLYGFSFYQRSYDRAYDFLSGPDLAARLLRSAGVDPRLSVCHQSFSVPLARVREFLDLYFDIFDEFADLESRVEQQDMIRLPECAWPLHAHYDMPGGAYLFTPSLSVRRGEASEQRASAFFRRVSHASYEQLGVKTLLLKQVHCDPALLRDMHRPFLDALLPIRASVGAAGKASPCMVEVSTPRFSKTIQTTTLSFSSASTSSATRTQGSVAARCDSLQSRHVMGGWKSALRVATIGVLVWAAPGCSGESGCESSSQFHCDGGTARNCSAEVRRYYSEDCAAQGLYCVEASQEALCALSSERDERCQEPTSGWCLEDGTVVHCSDGFPVSPWGVPCPDVCVTVAGRAFCAEASEPEPLCPATSEDTHICAGNASVKCREQYRVSTLECLERECESGTCTSGD